MNSAMTSGAVGGGVTMLAVVIVWAFTWPIKPPTIEVATAMAALLVTTAHVARNFIYTRFPAKAPVPPAQQ